QRHGGRPLAQTRIDTPSGDGAPPAAAAKARGRGLAFQLAALGLTVVSALAGTGLAHWLRSPGGGPELPAGKREKLVEGWDKPDLVLVLSGQQHGYLKPCGCSRPQVGGLERRYNFLKTLEAKGWPVVAVDLGDVAQKHGPAGLPNLQAVIKYRYS